MPLNEETKTKTENNLKICLPVEILWNLEKWNIPGCFGEGNLHILLDE